MLAARRATAFLVAGVVVFFAPIWLRGRTTFWGDLTYLHLAWRASPAQLVQAGRPPLWEPSLYLGMPMAASMQGGLFYPPTIAYYFFGFATATGLFEAFHLFLAGWLTAIWLRGLRLSWGASLASGICVAFSGLMISRLPFLNHLATLSWAPALAIFFRRPAPLAAALTLMFLAGYPTFLPGAAGVAWVVAFTLRTRRTGALAWSRDWTAAGALAAALSCAQLLPALELAALSRRSSGIEPAEALQWGFRLSDLRQWVSPLFVPLSSFHPHVDWWKCVYLGVGAIVAAAVGLCSLPRRRAAVLASLLAVVVLLILGDSNAVSRALWIYLPPLRYVRYPGNLSYLALAPLTALIGAGFARSGRRAPFLAMATVAELLCYGWISTPTVSRDLFATPGPLARRLQGDLKETRYLISPRALEASSGRDFIDWKTRLYGLTNAPYRLRAVANFGEPLVPQPNYAFMDRILSARNVGEAASWLPWAGASHLLTPEPVASPLLRFEVRELWSISHLASPVSTAYFFSSDRGAALPADQPEVPPGIGTPLRVDRPREDRFSITGAGGGWVYIAEPRYPGWKATLETPRGMGAVTTLPAIGPFQKVPVPDGPWRVSLRYEPAPWRWGVLASFAALLLFSGYWYHRLSRLSHVAQ